MTHLYLHKVQLKTAAACEQSFTDWGLSFASRGLSFAVWGLSYRQRKLRLLV
jgi:hypothetical protein